MSEANPGLGRTEFARKRGGWALARERAETMLQTQRERAPLLFGITVGLAATVLAALVQSTLLGAGVQKFPFIAFYPGVFLAAFVAGAPGGIVAALASAVVVHAFFAPVREVADLVAFGIFLTTCAMVSVTCGMLHARSVETRRLAEANALQSSLSHIVESSLEAIYSVSADGNVLSWNAGAERLYGYSASEMIGRSIARLAPRSSAPDLLQLSDFAKRGEAIVDFETRRKHRTGEMLTVSLTASPIRSTNGEAIGMSVIARDVTQRKRAENALRTALLQVHAKFENAAVGMADVAPDGRWLRVNGKLCQILGYERDALMRTTFADITHPDDLGTDLSHVEDLLAGRADSYSMEKRYFRRDGSVVWANLTVGKVYKPDGSLDHFLSIVEDIDERKRAESRVRLLTAEVNHRANNLLAVVQSIAQQTANIGDTKLYVANLRERIQGLAASQRLLVDNEWRGADLRALIEAQLAMFKDLLGARIFPEGPPVSLSSSAAQGIGMALHELATNAAKYGALSNDSGIVRIAWSTDGAAFRMSWTEEGGPTVEPPTRKGFGRLVLGRMAEAAVDGKAETDYRPTGVCWTLTGTLAPPEQDA